MSDHDQTDLPFYFGANGELFGMFHATAAKAGRAVLLCPPLGQDHIRSHRLYRQLACALAVQGIAVLRFDYYGTGDSAGASEQVDWNRCVADALVAVSELRARSGASEITAFGARLGGNVAIAVAKAGCIERLALWDPVLDGAAYVTQQDEIQLALAADTQRFVKPRSALDAASQWQGFAISDRLRQQILALRFEPVPLRTLVLDSMHAHSAADWRGTGAAPEPTVMSLQTPTPWDELDRLELAILSQPLIQSVTGYLREAA